MDETKYYIVLEETRNVVTFPKHFPWHVVHVQGTCIIKSSYIMHGEF